MTRGQVEALLTVLLAVAFLTLGAVATVRGPRTRVPSQWRRGGPVLAVVTLALLGLHQLMRSMTTAHVEALVLGSMTLGFLAAGVVASVQERRTGEPNPWRYAGPIVAAIGLTLVWFNLHGYVFGGPGGLDVTRPRP